MGPERRSSRAVDIPYFTPLSVRIALQSSYVRQKEDFDSGRDWMFEGVFPLESYGRIEAVMTLSRFTFAVLITLLLFPSPAPAGDRLVLKEGKPFLPIGFYELPEAEAELKRMADAGVNLVRCRDASDLDRAQSVGMMGVMPLGVENGGDEALREAVLAVRDHPALAIWEGPDEIVWNFTAYSGLHRHLGVYPTTDEWRRQTELALDYSNQQGSEIIPKILEGIALVRELDSRNLPFWINEAVESDARFVREYLDAIDITGCDVYPVNERESRLLRIPEGVERWKKVGRGKPVFMVLQAFSWNELGDYYGAVNVVYPTFEESRFMAYSSLVHGAEGLLYWGSRFLKSDEFRESIYALTRELAAIEPFLLSEDLPEVQVDILESPPQAEPGYGVRRLARRVGDEWLIALVNETGSRKMGVEVSGLEELNGRDLHLLYSSETLRVNRGEVVVRLQPFEVKLYASDRSLESPNRSGRDFGRE